VKIIKYTLSKVIDDDIEEKLINNIITDQTIMNMEIDYDLNQNNNQNKQENKKFICEECGCKNHDYISLMDHVLIVHDKSFKDEYVDDYVEEKKQNKVNKENINKTHECMICNEKFQSVFHLGEHFIEQHGNYETQTELDKNIIRDGYPSLDVLIHINMVNVIPFINIPKYQSEKCNICAGHFHYKKNINLEKETEKKVLCQFSDDIKLKNKKIIKNLSKDDNYLEDIEITDEEILTFIEDTKKFCNPINLNCCNLLICNTCLFEHIKIKNDIICPFCLSDFNLRENKFIEIYEFDKNNDSWLEWWKKHVDIFY
jgi:hypothetical protein